MKAAVKEGIDTASRLYSYSALQKVELRGHVEFRYTAPSDRGLAWFDPRGTRMSDGVLHFGIEIVPGLVVASTAAKTASREQRGSTREQ